MTTPDLQASQMSSDDALHRLRRLVNRLFLTILACVVVVAVLALSLRYVEAVGEGRRKVENFADLLSEYLVIRLRGIDGTLSRITADNRRLGGPDGSERDWASAIRSAIAGVSGLSSLVILDVDGVVRHTTVQQIRGLSWADRPVFQALARGVPNQVVVDPPVTMVAGNQVLVPFGRALTDPRGDFIGAVIAMLLPNQLRDFISAFDLGQSGIAWVLLPSGEVLFRDGAIDQLDSATASDPPLFVDGIAKTGEGLASGALAAGSGDYLTAYRKTAIADLVVAVSISDARFLAQWKYEVWTVLIVIGILAGFLYFAARRINAAALDIVASNDAEALIDRDTTLPPTID